MNKKEFLDGLRQSLEGEVDSSVIDQNIQYYQHYISSQGGMDEESIVEELGSPRLIAKTIIESERAAKQKGYYKGSGASHSTYYQTEEDKDNHQNTRNNKNGSSFHLTWTQKISLIIIVVILILVVVFISRLLIGLLFAFGVPILLILLLMALFKKRN